MNKTLFFSMLIIVFIHTSTNAQSGWFIISSPTTENLYQITYHSFTASDWVVGANGTLIKTPDHGETWESLNSGTSVDLKGRHGPASFQDWIAGNSGTVLVSLDNGANWTSRKPNTTVNFNTIFSRGSGTAYVAGENGSVFFSDDLGLTWSNRSAPTDEHLVCGVGPTSGTSLHALVGGTNGVIFKTIDAGENWTTPNSGTSNSINSFGFGPGNNILAVGDGGTILVSDDAGDSWTPISSPTIENLYSIDGSGQNANWLIACGANGTLLKSTDGGSTWFEQLSPTNEDLFSALALTNSVHLAVGANGTILKTVDGGGDPVGVGDNFISNEQFTLNQNIPNPFNNNTTIEFSLSTAGFVSLKCYNILGEEIATLVSETLNNGKHNRDWNTEGLKNGIYFYRLEVNGYATIRKCLLVL